MLEDLISLTGEIGRDLENLEKNTKDLSVYSDVKNINEKVTTLYNQLLCFDIKNVQQPVNPQEVGLDNKNNLKLLGKGAFGSVYKSVFAGTPVGIKVLESKDDPWSSAKELTVLRSLRHDNVISFRANGIVEGKLFIVMEYLEWDLMSFIMKHDTHDGSGLTAFMTWHIGHQVANGMLYLHSQGIVHGDLKPDNILLDTKPLNPIAKLCDFGLSVFSEDKGLTSGHVRYNPKESHLGFKDLKKLDVFRFGLVVLVARTGKRPWPEESTRDLEGKLLEVLHKSSTTLEIGKVKVSDADVTGEVGRLIRTCLLELEKRPLFDEIIDVHFSLKNPFQLVESQAEFFTCGFLKNTYIFVVDSVVPENAEEKRNPTYEAENLLCKVNLDKHEADKPNEDDIFQQYSTNLEKYEIQAEEKIIDNNVTIALKEIVLDRDGKSESQHITLSYKVSTYCHHRAMRDIWRNFDETQKNSLVPCKSTVNKMYSNSFGLHVAVLTNEEVGPPKFIFMQRSTQPGMASPGKFTCGAVESCSEKDFVDPKASPAILSLRKTAARGLHEEIGIELTEEESVAINLNTIYLKFDNHEWGLCGFVDLSDKRISEANRFSFEQISAAFTTGPKDRFEHSRIVAVDFELQPMVEWIREHHDKLASSSKIVVVKVLQARFGMPEVTREFAKYQEISTENDS